MEISNISIHLAQRSIRILLRRRFNSYSRSTVQMDSPKPGQTRSFLGQNLWQNEKQLKTLKTKAVKPPKQAL